MEVQDATKMTVARIVNFRAVCFVAGDSIKSIYASWILRWVAMMKRANVNVNEALNLCWVS
jgi:hypothetical protein